MKYKWCAMVFCGAFFSAVSLFAQGSVLLMGGGSDTKAWADDVFHWLVQQADSGVVINIDVDEVAPSYASTFIRHGADAASRALRIPTRTAANDSATYRALVAAKGIWMEGGDQYDYVSTWKGTLVEEAIRTVWQNGGVVGGTSAGCAVLGQIVFDAKYGGLAPRDAAYNPFHGDVHLETDLWAFLPDVLTDTHFHSRGRLGRLLALWARRVQDADHTSLLGIGVADQTALCIDKSGQGMCFGNGTVSLIWGDEQTAVHAEAGRPLHATDVHFDQLIHGCVWDLNTRRLVSAGPGLDTVAPEDFPLPQPPVVLSGSAEASADSAQIIVSGLTSNDLNAWYGRLSFSEGTGSLSGWTVMPRLWSDSHHYENRWMGGMAAMVRHPGLRVLYLDTPTSVAVDMQHRLIVSGGPAYVLDGSALTCAGFPVHRSTDYCGWTGGVIHALAPGDTLALSAPTAVLDGPSSPVGFRFSAPYPNPFNPATTLAFEMQQPGCVELSVFNSLGQHVETLIDEERPAGAWRVQWQAGDQPSGRYFFRLRQGGQQCLQRGLYLK